MKMGIIKIIVPEVDEDEAERNQWLQMTGSKMKMKKRLWKAKMENLGKGEESDSRKETMK